MTTEYDRLLDQYEQIAVIESIQDQLVWDQQVTMPSGGTPARERQFGALSTLRHELLTDDMLAERLNMLSTDDLNTEQAAVIRAIRRKHQRAVSVPRDLAQALSEAQTEAQDTWQRAREENDFSVFAPSLERLRDLHVERAHAIDASADPFEVLHDESLPNVSLGRVEKMFNSLRETLVPLLNRIQCSDVTLTTPFEQVNYPVADQRRVLEYILDSLSYDWNHGRLDQSEHPFTVGTQFDCRITTARDRGLIERILSILHEFGHATYQLGLPRDQAWTPLGESLDNGVHESQSRFWENHVGRSQAFWEYVLPLIQHIFPALTDITAQQAYKAVNRIRPDNCIRTNADEITYHLHILVRFEVGKAFVRREIDVTEIPERWNNLMSKYLGVVPSTPREGPLQDIHWSSWFAAFQEYTVGSVLAAQFDAAMRADLDVDENILTGDFKRIRNWMTNKVHSHGRLYPTDELIKHTTGDRPNTTAFLSYIEQKYSRLYDL